MEKGFYIPGLTGMSWGKSQEPSRVVTGSTQSTAADQGPVVGPVIMYDATLDSRHREHEARIGRLERRLERLTKILEASEEEVIELRDVPYEQAKQEIAQYFRDHHGDEIDAGILQEELGIELSMAAEICEELEQGGKIKEL